jgi:hypothetical protein
MQHKSAAPHDAYIRESNLIALPHEHRRSYGKAKLAVARPGLEEKNIYMKLSVA